MAPARLLVCSDCAQGLVNLGASYDEGPIEITAGRICDAHPTSLPVQSTRAVFALPAAFQSWIAEARARLSSVAPPRVEDVEAMVIARVAGSLLTGHPTASDIEIESAVETARRIFVASKGGPR